MADFERRLEASRACLQGPGSVEVTAVHLTGDKAEPFVSTSLGMSYANYGMYPTLFPLVVRMNRVALGTHSDLPRIQPLAMWAHRLCMRQHHDPTTKSMQQPGNARLERIFAVMLPQEDSYVLDSRQIGGAILSEKIPNAGFAYMRKLQHISELFNKVHFVQPPLTRFEESQAEDPTNVLLLGGVGKTTVYGNTDYPIGEGHPITDIVIPSELAGWKLER